MPPAPEFSATERRAPTAPAPQIPEGPGTIPWPVAFVVGLLIGAGFAMSLSEDDGSLALQAHLLEVEKGFSADTTRMHAEHSRSVEELREAHARAIEQKDARITSLQAELAARGDEAPAPRPVVVRTAESPLRSLQARTNRLRVRAGPGPSFGVVEHLKRGQRVLVERGATGGWVPILCTDRGESRWVKEDYLEAAPR